VILNVVESPASSVTVTDTLPANMTFVSFGMMPAGGVTTVSGNNLMWVFPTLPVGPATLTYRAQIGNFLPGGTVLTNNAQLTYFGNPVPQKASVDITISSIYTVKLGVYNGAGELVKQIWVREYSQQITNFTMPSAAITSVHGVVYVEVDGQVLATWDGTNQVGDPVSNGSYYMKMDSVDPYGVVKSVSEVVTVSRSIAEVSVNVYNEAGEVVRHIYTYVDDPGTMNLGDVQLSSTVIQPTANATAASGTSAVTLTFPNGLTLTWDGKNDSGQVVTNGNYLMEVHWVNGTGGDEVISKGVVVENRGYLATNGNVYVQPNILKGGVTSATVVAPTTGNLTLTVNLYDMAGELVKKPVTGQAGTNVATLDVTGLSSGLYFVVVDLTDPNTGHFVQKQVTQIVILR
jgi:flagellar hook assembly protein FlgD